MIGGAPDGLFSLPMQAWDAAEYFDPDSGDELTRLLQRLVRDSVRLGELTEAGRNEPKIEQLSIAGLIAAAIESSHEESSVSRLFL